MGEDRFLERWSRLKRAAEEAPPDEAPPDEAAEPVAAAAIEPDLTPEEVAALPDVASLATPDALRVFLRRGVPPLLRQAALRRMWVLNPAIRDYVDDAREYAMDWNAPGGVPGGGIVSRAEAQALAERLFAPREPRPAPSGEPEVPRAESQTKIEQVPEILSQNPLVAGAQTPPVAGAQTAGTPDDALDHGTDDPPPPRRRHGGATPV